MVDHRARARCSIRLRVRDYLGDGNFGGCYQRSDEDMLALWQVAVEETRALLDGTVGRRMTPMRDPHLGRGRDRRHASAPASRAPATTSRSSTTCASTSMPSTATGCGSPGRSPSSSRARRPSRPTQLRRRRGTRSSSRPRRITPSAAARALLPHLRADGCVVSAQNGLNELTIADVVGDAAHGRRVRQLRRRLPRSRASIHYGGRGAVVVGEIDGRDRRRASTRSATRGCDFEPTRDRRPPNIWGYLWGKEAYGAMLFATALTNESIADALAMPAYRPLYVALAREILAVAAARGVTPEAFDGFDPARIPARTRAPRRRRRARSTQLVAHNRKLGQDAQRHLARPRRAQAARPKSTRSSASIVTLGARGRRADAAHRAAGRR